MPDDEQRRLGEIERELAAEDPRLARRFDQPVAAGALAAVVSGVLILLGAGGMLILMGVRLGMPIVVGIGVVIAAVLPVLVWVARR